MTIFLKIYAKKESCACVMASLTIFWHFWFIPQEIGAKYWARTGFSLHYMGGLWLDIFSAGRAGPGLALVPHGPGRAGLFKLKVGPGRAQIFRPVKNPSADCDSSAPFALVGKGGYS